MSATEVEVARMPQCDFGPEQALYDGRTQLGPWAYMCQKHFDANGTGLGLGRGQRLVMAESDIADEHDAGCMCGHNTDPNARLIKYSVAEDGPDHAPGRCLGSDCTDPYHARDNMPG